MAKVDVDLVKMVMTRTGLDVRTVAQVIEEINLELKAQADEEEKPPPVKKQFVMMVSDPEGKLEGVDLVGWVLQIPEEDSVYVTEERLFRCAYEYNMSKKGRRMPVKTIADVCEHGGKRARGQPPGVAHAPRAQGRAADADCGHGEPAAVALGRDRAAGGVQLGEGAPGLALGHGEQTLPSHSRAAGDA